MAGLARYFQKIFGSTAGSNQLSQFGSFAAGTPQRYSGSTINPSLVQNLSNYAGGIFNAIVAGAAIAREDENSLHYLWSYQLAYILSRGIPAWDPSTTYNIGDFASDGAGNIYGSLTNSNLNNALTTAADWGLVTRTTVGQQISSSCGNWSHAASGFTPITNLSVNITTHGRPVILFLQPDGSGSSGYIGAVASSGVLAQSQFQISRGSTALNIFDVAWEANNATSGPCTILVPPGTIYFMDTPVAGSYTYSVSASASSPNEAVASYSVLVAYEL